MLRHNQAKTLKTRFILLSSLLILVSAKALSATSAVEAINSIQPNSEITFGTELDALPFITGGYYFSAIGGLDQFRLRGIISQVYLPGFAYDSANFTKSSLSVYALVLDYFFSQNYRGYWVGGGVENWTGKVNGNIAGTSGTFQEWVSTLGTGYNWFFYENFYVNPWFAVHAKLTGDSQAQVGSQVYLVRSFEAEGSLKIGWYF